MDRGDIEMLRDAFQARQRKEPVERAVGRAVRRAGQDFGTYIRLMSELRGFASERRLDLDAALSALADEEYQAE